MVKTLRFMEFSWVL